MKKNLIIGGIIAIVVLWAVSSYNGIVDLKVATETQWANVESSYQRRADLIPSLQATVKGYAEYEKSTFVEVTEARSKATSMTISADDLTPENIAKFQAAQSQLSGSLSRLLATFERYPDLKANQNFLEFQSQLEGTENRINVERNRFNVSGGKYKSKIEKIPGALFANMFGFEPIGLFAADSGSENAPKVEF